MAIKYVCDANPFYVHFKKHYCPLCGNKVIASYISKTVNSKSIEAKDYDFSFGDVFLIGDVEFRIRCFYCKSCDINISIKEMQLFEGREKGNKT